MDIDEAIAITQETITFLRHLQAMYLELPNPSRNIYLCEDCFLPFVQNSYCPIHPRGDRVSLSDGLGVLEERIRGLEIDLLDLQHNKLG